MPIDQAPQPSTDGPSNPQRLNSPQPIGYFDIRRNFRSLLRFMRGIETLISSRGNLQNQRPTESGSQQPLDSQNSDPSEVTPQIPRFITNQSNPQAPMSPDGSNPPLGSFPHFGLSSDTAPSSGPTAGASASDNPDSTQNAPPQQGNNGVITRIFVSIGPSSARASSGPGVMYQPSEESRVRNSGDSDDLASELRARFNGVSFDQQPQIQHPPQNQWRTSTASQPASNPEDTGPVQEFPGRASPNDIIAINVVLSVLTQIIRDGNFLVLFGSAWALVLPSSYSYC